MKKSSWIALSICAALSAVTLFVYLQSTRPSPEMSIARVRTMLDGMRGAVAHKNVRALMSYVDTSPDTHISHLNTDQLRLLLAKGFRQSDSLDAQYSDLKLHNESSQSVADFELTVTHHMPSADADEYKGHITLYLHLVEVPHLLGLYHTKQWMICRAETLGPDIANYGDY